MILVQIVSVVLVVPVLICLAEDLPSFIHVCHRDEPNMQECFIAAAEELRPYLVKAYIAYVYFYKERMNYAYCVGNQLYRQLKDAVTKAIKLIHGVPDYDIPSLEPLLMNELISEESGGLRVTAKDVKAWGCTDYFIRNIKFDLDKQTYEIDLDLPLLRIEARYNISGKIMVMPVKGEGPLEANVTGCKAKTILEGELYDKDGDTYMRYTKMSMKVEVGGGHIKMDNLFNGDKLLNDIVNDTINKNLSAFFNELMPVIERALSSTFLDIANKIVKRFTFKQLYPH